MRMKCDVLLILSLIYDPRISHWTTSKIKELCILVFFLSSNYRLRTITLFDNKTIESLGWNSRFEKNELKIHPLRKRIVRNCIIIDNICNERVALNPWRIVNNVMVTG